MMAESVEYRLGELDARMKSVETRLGNIKECTDDISNALTKGKGVFIGLLIAASSAGAMISELIKKLFD